MNAPSTETVEHAINEIAWVKERLPLSYSEFCGIVLRSEFGVRIWPGEVVGETLVGGTLTLEDGTVEQTMLATFSCNGKDVVSLQIVFFASG